MSESTNSGLLPTRLQLDEKRKACRPSSDRERHGRDAQLRCRRHIRRRPAGATGSLDTAGFSPGVSRARDCWSMPAAASSGTGTNTAIRLDSTYQFADVNTLRRYSLGDFITGGLAWTRPVRLEGVQIRSDFSMRPDLVTFPLPIGHWLGRCALHDGRAGERQLWWSRARSTAGPFEIPQLPVVSGAGTISMTVTNALGQQVTVTQPFYASSSLLAPGLQTFAVQAGVVRRNWGSVSNDYGKIAGTAMYRRGLTPKFTVEGSVEGTPGTIMAGAGGVAKSAISACSISPRRPAPAAGTSGAQFSAGAQRIGRVFSLGASATIAGRNFRDVAAMNGEPVPRKQLSANTGLSLRRFGSVGVAYGGLDQDCRAQPWSTLDVTPAEHSIYSLPAIRSRFIACRSTPPSFATWPAPAAATGCRSA